MSKKNHHFIYTIIHMKNYYFLIISFFYSTNLFSQNYPETKKIPLTFTKHNISYQDDYSWLENMDSPEVKNWVDKQNKIFEENYSRVKSKVSTINNLKIYNDATTGQVSINTKGLKFYFSGINPKKSPVLFMQRNSNSEFQEIVDPNKIYPNKNVIIDDISTSLNSKYLAYALRINGSDKLQVRFVDLNKKENIKDSLLNIKFSNISWNKDEGIFYKLNTNKSLFAKDSTFKVFYHKLNTNQKRR